VIDNSRALSNLENIASAYLNDVNKVKNPRNFRMANPDEVKVEDDKIKQLEQVETELTERIKNAHADDPELPKLIEQKLKVQEDIQIAMTETTQAKYDALLATDPDGAKEYLKIVLHSRHGHCH
jgi:hypothetical protein